MTADPAPRGQRALTAAASFAEDDQVVPVGNSMRPARIIKNAEDIYSAAPHGIIATHQDQVNADMLAFMQS